MPALRRGEPKCDPIDPLLDQSVPFAGASKRPRKEEPGSGQVREALLLFPVTVSTFNGSLMAMVTAFGGCGLKERKAQGYGGKAR